MKRNIKDKSALLELSLNANVIINVNIHPFEQQKLLYPYHEGALLMGGKNKTMLVGSPCRQHDDSMIASGNR